MFLTIDIGNTRTKAAVFNTEGQMVYAEILEGNELDTLNSIVSAHHIQHVISSSTSSRNWNPADLKVPGKNIALSHETSLPITIVYTTPNTLGRDRIAAACGAHALFPDKNCLIVDAGTCITMDMILKTGTYLGGNIAPGLTMRLRSMHEYTAKLPLAEIGWPSLTFGDSTFHALQNGACLGALMEIEGILSRALDAFGAVFVVMTGGDSAFLAQRVESEIFLEPELVTKGLFKILSFNAQ
ncbi:MAG TPA: type III pantothenate kinase [Saprospiraceae bacterium]|nr:type III pantothenate kinase [Saprospiraceae bacterium]